MNHAVNGPKELTKAQQDYQRRLRDGGVGRFGDTMTDEQAVDFHRALLASGKSKPPVS